MQLTFPTVLVRPGHKNAWGSCGVGQACRVAWKFLVKTQPFDTLPHALTLVKHLLGTP